MKCAAHLINCSAFLYAAVVVPQKLITGSRFLFEHQTVAQLVRFIAFCGKQRFITVFTTAAYRSMP